jgi:ribosome-binding factor A
MASDRMRRVDEAIRQVIGTAVGRLRDPRVGFITVTDVRTSSDLSHARVFVSVLGDAEQRADSLAGLRSAHGFLQSQIASELHLKRTPTLTFAYDDTTDRALRVEELIEASGEPGPSSSNLAAGDEQGSAPFIEGGAAGREAGEPGPSSSKSLEEIDRT